MIIEQKILSFTPATLEEYKSNLYQEERSVNTITKYIHDIGEFFLF